jgi:hypothetical protein
MLYGCPKMTLLLTNADQKLSASFYLGDVLAMALRTIAAT